MPLKLINTSYPINSKYFTMRLIGMITLCLFISLWIASKMIIMNDKLILLNNKINLQNEIIQNYVSKKEHNDFKKSIENLYKERFSTIQAAKKNLHDELAYNIARIDQELIDLDYIIDDIKFAVSNNDNEKTQLFKTLNDNVVKQSDFEDFAYAVSSLNEGRLWNVYRKHGLEIGPNKKHLYPLRIPKYLYKVYRDSHSRHQPKGGITQEYIDKLYEKKHSLSPKEMNDRLMTV